MPKAPDKNRAEAERLFKEGMALVEIAGKLGVSEGTVRCWKARNWGKKPQGKQKAALQKNDCNAAAKKTDDCNGGKRKRQGAPPGNKNAFKHGGYSATFWDTLDQKELEMVMDMPEDEEQMLMDEIRLCTARERRIMQAVNWYRGQQDRLSVAGVSRQEEKRQFKDEEEKQKYEDIIAEKVENGERMPGTRYQEVTSKEPKDSAIARLERELSVIQGKKAQMLQILADLRIERLKLDGDADKNDIVQAWIDGLDGI